MEAGEKLKESSQLPADKQNVEDKLANITRRWDDLNDKSRDRAEALDKAVELTSEYQALRGEFVPWLEGAEKRVRETPLSCDPEELKSLKGNLEVGSLTLSLPRVINLQFPL